MRRPHVAIHAAAGVQLWLALHASAATHYEQPPCQPDETQGEVQGASGYVCAPRCAEDSYNCPGDVPSSASAQPQCMLQDINRRALCGLLCQVDAQCPSGAQCKQLAQIQVGICLYPISFADWARQGNIQKLAVGWPSKPGGQSGLPAGFQVAKTYAALQSLKSRYSIEDGDADMLVLKELLATLKPAASPSSVGGPPPPAQGASGGGGGGSSQQRSDAPWMPHDVTQFESYWSRGVPGVEREVQDTVWNIENINQPSAASNLLSGLLWIIAIYLAVGSFFKYQQGARGMEMIPHVGFWAEYPKLVADGVTYSKILMGFIPADGGGLSGGIPAPGIVGRGGAGAFEAL